MKHYMIIGAAFAAFVVATIFAVVLTGCTVTKAEWGGQVPVLDAVGNPIILTNGMAQVVNLPNRFYNNRHWMDTNIQTAKMDVQKDRYGVELNGYSSVVSTQFVAFAKVTADAVTEIAAKVVSACASQGVTIGLDAAKALVGKYLGSGGDPEKMSVECKDGSCTISDGSVECSDGSCYDVE